jgi:dTDP-4-amino-4,6-dideoxygalactose transaminase
MCRYHHALGKTLLALNNSANRERQWRSEFLIQGLEHLSAEPVLSIPRSDSPVPYLRLPVIFRDERMRDRILERLVRNGIGATSMYRVPLAEIEGVAEHIQDMGEYPNAKRTASRLLTLPVSGCLSGGDLDKIVRIVEETLQDAKSV